MTLNNLFDTTKPIIESIAAYGLENDHLPDHLPDDIFSQALREYKMEDEEDDVLLLMVKSDLYRFTRGKNGWDVYQL